MSDFEAFAAHWADPIAMQYLRGDFDRRSAWRLFASSTGMWILRGAGWWAVELKETGETVGAVGAFFREDGPDLELGWNVFRQFWRRGYATEAAAAALTHGFEAHGVDRIIAHIDASNLPSRRVGEHLGMRYDGDVDFYGTMVGRYVRDR